jgi:hypothetical protein
LWPEVAVHVEALVVAQTERIWRWRPGMEVDGASSGLGKLRWTGAQLLVVVTGPGAHQSGPAMERHPQQRKRMAAWWGSIGSDMARSVMRTVLCQGGTPVGTEERGVARHCSSTTAAASGAEEQVRARERGKEEERDFTSSMGHNGEGIRVTGWLEAVGDARGHGKPQWCETRGGGGPMGTVVLSDVVRRAVKGIARVGHGPNGLGPVRRGAGLHSEGGRPV